MKNSIKILNLDAKDIFIANNYMTDKNIGYNIRRNDDGINLRKFSADLDFCLDLIKLREVYERVYRNRKFSFFNCGKEYTTRVINVTFDYSVKLFNRITPDTYVRFGYNLNELEFNDNLCIMGGELIAVKVDSPVSAEADKSVLGKYFYFEKGCYKAKGNIPVIGTVADLRRSLYENGFYCDGVKYIRFKRSSGSSRVGKCLFIDEKLYKQMHKWECCGLKIKEGDKIDLAAFEAYISLTLSSIIDTVQIEPENILLIDDYESVFNDEVAEVTYEDGTLKEKTCNAKIVNSIWDGQSLMDVSMFEGYEEYSMLLLRNRFFKSAAFKTDIGKFFDDFGITQVSQLNGHTRAKNISDIKLITTPNSIKYLKFGSFDKWLDNLDLVFGVVKHEKPTPYFDGKFVRSHYQLLNTLQLSYDETTELLSDSLNYLTEIRYDPAVLRHHIKCPKGYESSLKGVQNKNDVIYKLLGLNEDFTRTKLYHDFVCDLLKSLKKSLMSGHVLINGNYSTLFGNPFEMLLQSIGKFDGRSILGEGRVWSRRFKDGVTLLGSRSPHICAGNILLTTNSRCEEIEKYFPLSEEIICVNSIGENLLQKLNG